LSDKTDKSYPIIQDETIVSIIGSDVNKQREELYILREEIDLEKEELNLKLKKFELDKRKFNNEKMELEKKS
jgi:hypothetical protein